MGVEVGEGSTEALNLIFCFSPATEAQACKRRRVGFYQTVVHQAGMPSGEEQGGGGKNIEMVREEKAFGMLGKR